MGGVEVGVRGRNVVEDLADGKSGTIDQYTVNDILNSN